ncbi:MAG TPA: CPBP family intramembrane metalloprotease, partial [Actinomycetales bacterium]|nr:CPBP family intramembrane metalloprotease [Actinomycetales bacterium]
MLILAPVDEELAWHSYGTDSLRSRFSLFTTSMIFAVVWALWHAPLALFAGSSQEQTVEQGLIHALNFPLSMLPFVLLMNWIYYRGDRNITLTILVHLGANLSTQVMSTHPDTEVMSTGVLLVLTTVILWRERALFFTA